MIPYLEKLADRTFSQLSKSHNLTRSDITELFERLSCLAYNIVGYCACTDDYERTSKYHYPAIDAMLDAVSKKKAWKALYSTDAELSDEQTSHAVNFLVLAQEADLIVQSEKLVFFADHTLSMYFCAQFFRQHLKELMQLRWSFIYHFEDAWKILNQQDSQVLLDLLARFEQVHNSKEKTDLFWAIVATNDLRAVNSLIAYAKTKKKYHNLYNVINSFKSIQSKPALDFLVEILNSNEDRLSDAAALSLAHYGEEGLAILIEATKSQDSIIRQAALQGLWHSENERATEPIIAALQDNDEKVRERAVWCLVSYNGDSRIFEALISCLQDSSSAVRNAVTERLETVDALKALTFVWPALPLIDIASLIKRAIRQDKQAVARNHAIANGIINCLNDSDPQTQYAAMELASLLELEAAAEPIFKLATPYNITDHLLNRYFAFLAKKGNQRAIELLLQALPTDQDKYSLISLVETIADVANPEISEAAFKISIAKGLDLTYQQRRMLGDRSDPQPYEYFLRRLQKGEAYQRSEAIQELGLLKDKRAVLPLINALQNEPTYMHEYIIEALGLLGYVEVLPTLEDIQRNDESKLNRYLATKAIREIKKANTSESK